MSKSLQFRHVSGWCMSSCTNKDTESRRSVYPAATLSGDKSYGSVGPATYDISLEKKVGQRLFIEYCDIKLIQGIITACKYIVCKLIFSINNI